MVVMADEEARPVFPVGRFCEGLRTAWVYMLNYSAAEQRQCGEDLNRWLAEGKLRANTSDPAAGLMAVAHRLQEGNTIHVPAPCR